MLLRCIREKLKDGDLYLWHQARPEAPTKPDRSSCVVRGIRKVLAATSIGAWPCGQNGEVRYFWFLLGPTPILAVSERKDASLESLMLLPGLGFLQTSATLALKGNRSPLGLEAFCDG